MERKLIKQGGGGYTIYLPKNWIEKNSLDKGSEIDVIEDENKLIISSKAAKKEKIVKIDVSNLYPLVNRSLLALYIKGVDEIEVNYSNASEIKDFQKRVVSQLLGFEIVKQGQNNLTLRDVTGSENQEIDDLIKRIFLILDSIIDEIIIASDKRKGFEQLIEADESVNRICNFCLRILNKRGYKEYNKTSQIYGIINRLEEIGDSLKNICRYIIKNKLTKNDIKNLNDIRILLDSFKGLIFNFDKDNTVQSAKKYQKIKENIAGKNILDLYMSQLLDDIIKINNYLLVFSLGKE